MTYDWVRTFCSQSSDRIINAICELMFKKNLKYILMQCKTKHKNLNLYFFFFKDDSQSGEINETSSSRREDKFEIEKISVSDMSEEKKVVATKGNEEKEMVAIGGDEESVVAIGGVEEKVVAIGGDEGKVVAIGGDEGKVVAFGGVEEKVVAIGGDEEKEAVATKGNEGIEEEDINEILGVNLEQETLDKKIKKFIDLVCPICTEQSEDKSFYLYHLEKHREYDANNSLFYRCLVCEKTIGKKPETINHYIYFHDKILKCFICELNFKRKTYLKTHLKCFHALYEHRCKECCFFTYDKKYFSIHIRCHQDNLDHKCRYCSFSLNDVQLVLYHEENHHKFK